jgi:hypothetical protein
MSKNNIFISWSGKRSLYAAELLRDWLPNVVQAAKPWMSDRDIEKGTKGLTEVGKALEGMKVGIVCLTAENLDAPWILYEAGALSKTFSDDKTRLCTYLLGGLQPQNVKPPLSMFQWTKSEKEDTRKLVQTVNTAISEEPLPTDRLNMIFDTWWPQLENKLDAMPAPEKIVDARRDPNEMISEILDLCRQYLPGRDNAGLDPTSFNRFDVLRRALITDINGVPSRSIMVKLKGSQDYQVIHNVTGVSEMTPGTLLISQSGGTGSGYTNVEDWGYLAERKSTGT